MSTREPWRHASITLESPMKHLGLALFTASLAATLACNSGDNDTANAAGACASPPNPEMAEDAQTAILAAFDKY